jgi:2-dehydro-3-deoxygluconokinase
MKPVVCFGELLLRYSPDADAQWISGNAMPVYIGGAELNVASALGKWNIPVNYVTSLPDHFISEQIMQHVQSRSVNANNILLQGNKIGSYYLPQGADLKHNAVLYDRNHSSFYTLKKGMIDWKSVFSNASWFHFSAICASLNNELVDVCEEALIAAKSMGIMVSIDLNYRPALWKYGKQPVDVMPQLVKYADVLMGNLWSIETMLGIKSASLQHCNNHEDYLQCTTEICLSLIQQYSQLKQIANTFRFTNNEVVNYSGALFANNILYSSKHFNGVGVKDKAGSGDCFMAGLIYAYLNNYTSKQSIDFAASAAFGKLFIEGDATTETISDIQSRII